MQSDLGGRLDVDNQLLATERAERWGLSSEPFKARGRRTRAGTNVQFCSLATIQAPRGVEPIDVSYREKEGGVLVLVGGRLRRDILEDFLELVVIAVLLLPLRHH